MLTSKRQQPSRSETFGTSYESLFRQLLDIVEQDERRIAQAGARAYMPLVLLVVGHPPAPNDAWSASWRDLVIDDEVQVGDSAVPRALLVPVCVEPQAEAACRELLYPPSTSRAYRAKDVTCLQQLLVTILVHAARHQALLSEAPGGPLLPAEDTIVAYGTVIAGGPRAAAYVAPEPSCEAVRGAGPHA